MGLAIVLGVAAALGTMTGLFLGMPAAGFVLWPITRAVCRRARIDIDLHDDDDPVMKLEGSVAAGLGMALGVGATVLVVGALVQAPGTLLAAAAGAVVAGLSFGALWRHGYANHSATPQVASTALLAAIAAALAAL